METLDTQQRRYGSLSIAVGFIGFCIPNAFAGFIPSPEWYLPICAGLLIIGAIALTYKKGYAAKIVFPGEQSEALNPFHESAITFGIALLIGAIISLYVYSIAHFPIF